MGGLGQEEEVVEEEAAADIVPLFVDRLVSHETDEVHAQLADGSALHVRQWPREGPDALGTGTERVRQTGSVVWDGSVALAQHVSRPGALGPRCDVALELGAGCSGLVGLAIARACPAARVLLTDRAPLLGRLRENARANTAAGREPLEVVELLWGQTRLEELAGRVEVIAAADTVYDVELVAPLLASVRYYLAPQGRCLVAFDTSVGRHRAYEAFEAAAASDEALRCEALLDEETPAHVRMLSLTRALGGSNE